MAENTRKIKLVHITTVPGTQLMFLRVQVQFMKSRGFEVHAVSSSGVELNGIAVRTASASLAIRLRTMPQLISLSFQAIDVVNGILEII